MTDCPESTALYAIERQDKLPFMQTVFHEFAFLGFNNFPLLEQPSAHDTGEASYVLPRRDPLSRGAAKNRDVPY